MNTQDIYQTNQIRKVNNKLNSPKSETCYSKGTEITDSSKFSINLGCEHSLKGESKFKNAKTEELESFEHSSMGDSIYEKSKEARIYICPFDDCRKEYSNKCRLEIHIRTHVRDFVNF